MDKLDVVEYMTDRYLERYSQPAPTHFRVFQIVIKPI